ncbi:alkaline phosphatase family protein [Kibdelosporangium persicum]|uniref:Type I phosphodiesterase / nucleotide pyrophosphatase n=1 Tax=Kibdelosporangium persicum TaxID=2698649 RepID=A0ABX2F434_9PSEU|nr:nucleotide pyrophosphatase/phosphodiesterase family protein [Kibdelosporangium persicum]NRN65958.1 Type I phosphodiesterase / nucleotide pyrophosphatase [Kibdelosporangium persicum]
MGSPLVPRYGSGSLSDVVPSIMAGLGVPGLTPAVPLPEARKVCLLLVDGLGWAQLKAHPGDAPFLTSLAGAEITAGFPATTATSLTTIGTGVPAGRHGIVGYTFAASDDELINALSWGLHAGGRTEDFREKYVPEQFQPVETLFQRAADHGVRVRVATHRTFEGSGLTRAAFRGGDFGGTLAMGDLAMTAVEALTSGDRTFCYAYHSELDLLGHVFGPGSMAWRFQLRQVDRLAETIAGELPPDGLLVVTADHGMVAAPEEDRIDFDSAEDLRSGVRMLGGEARARHVYTEPGALADVQAAWSALLDGRAWLLPRDEAIAAGWFGPGVTDYARGRIGDLVVAAQGTSAIIRSKVEPRMSLLSGQHGSLTAEDQLIPLLTATAA